MSNLLELTKYEFGDDDQKYEYEKKFIFNINAYDKCIQSDLKKGYFFEKYVTMAIYAFCEKDDIIFDIGANTGSIAIPCAKKFHVYAFEAFKQSYDIMILNIKENNVQDNISAFNVAIGDTSRIILMDTSVPNIENNYGALMIGTQGPKSIMMKLDDLLQSIKKVKLIKVDTEGSEPLVFYGARKIIKRDMPIIIFEKNAQTLGADVLHNMNVDKKIYNFNIIEYCKKLGYEKIIYLKFEDIMLIPPGIKRTFNDKLFQFQKTEYIPYLKKYNIDTMDYKLYKLLKVDWNRTYENIPDIRLPDNQIIDDINKYAYGVFSKNEEDGIINLIFQIIGTTNKYYVEFEIYDESKYNTRYLRETNNWSGLLMDRRFKNKYIGLYKEYITENNILELFKKYNVPPVFDLLSVSADSKILNIWDKICTSYNPRVIIISYKFKTFLPKLFKLGKKYNYSLIGEDGTNIYFVKSNDIKSSGYVFPNIIFE